jgi:hypothetical protein
MRFPIGVGAPLVEERLQNQSRGHLIDNPTMLLALVAGRVKDLVGFVGGKPFIPEMDRQICKLSELGGKGLRLFGLPASLSVELERVADHDRNDGILPRQSRQRTEIVARAAFALDGHYRLRRQTQLVRNGNTNAPVADVKGEVAGLGRRSQLRALSY